MGSVHFYSHPKWKEFLAKKQRTARKKVTFSKASSILTVAKKTVEKNGVEEKKYRDRIYKAAKELSVDQISKLFFQTEKHIKSDFFWWWFEFVITASENDEDHLIELPKIIKRYVRLSGSFTERQDAYEKYQTEYELYGHEKDKKVQDDVATKRHENQKIFNAICDKVVVYKGFVTLDEERLKPSQTDIGRHQFHAARRGWSFTLDPLRAEWFSWRFHKHAVLFMQEYGEEYASDLLPFLGRPTVGRYELDRKDILIFTNDRNEKEIIADPSNATLQDYDFLERVDLIRQDQNGGVTMPMLSEEDKFDDAFWLPFEEWSLQRSRASYKPKKARY